MSAAVDVVIVNWNAGPLLLECVASLAEADRGRDRLNVLIVDNASTDGSMDALPTGDLTLSVMRNTVNRGFAAACNEGAVAGRAPYLLFLNPDTRVTGGVLERVLDFMDASTNRDIGICGVQLTDRTGVVSRSCSYHPTPARMLAALIALDRLLPKVVRPHAMADWDHAGSRDVEQVIGAFFFVRRVLFERLRGFDERFFVYYEEVDFARRAAMSGAKTHYLAGVSAFHQGAGTTDSVRAFRQFLVTQSRMLYAFKHFRRPVAVLHAIGSLAVEPLVRVAYFLARGELRSARESLVAAHLLWRGAGSLLRGAEVEGTRPPPAPVPARP